LQNTITAFYSSTHGILLLISKAPVNMASLKVERKVYDPTLPYAPHTPEIKVKGKNINIKKIFFLSTIKKLFLGPL